MKILTETRPRGAHAECLVIVFLNHQGCNVHVQPSLRVEFSRELFNDLNDFSQIQSHFSFRAWTEEEVSGPSPSRNINKKLHYTIVLKFYRQMFSGAVQCLIALKCNIHQCCPQIDHSIPPPCPPADTP
jgi:hypothetical protein